MKDMKSKVKNIILLNAPVFVGSHFIYHLREIPMKFKTTLSLSSKRSLLCVCLTPFSFFCGERHTEAWYYSEFKADEVNFIGTPENKLK